MAGQPLAPGAVAALVTTVTAWELVEVCGAAADRVELRAAGRLFAVVGPEGVELELPSRIGAMLVETGRAEAQAEGSRVLCRPDASGLIDPDLLLLAYERARVSARVAGR